MVKLLNNFKNYQSMIRESKKDLPDGYCQMRTGYINPSGRITYGQKLKSSQVKIFNYKVTILDDFIDQTFAGKFCHKQKFNNCLCPLTYSEFFKIIDLEWFRRRFIFDSLSELKAKCQFFTGYANGLTVYIVRRQCRFGFTDFVIEL